MIRFDRLDQLLAAARRPRRLPAGLITLALAVVFTLAMPYLWSGFAAIVGLLGRGYR